MEVYHLIDFVYLSFTRGQGLQSKCVWKLPTVDDSAITHLAWSPWIDMSSNSNKFSLLAACRFDGSVHLAKIVINGSEGNLETCEIQSDMARELLPRQRIPASKLSWKRW